MKTIKYLIGYLLATVTLCSNAAEGSRPFFERSLPTVAKYATLQLFDALCASSYIQKYQEQLAQQKTPCTAELASPEFQQLGQEKQIVLKKMPLGDALLTNALAYTTIQGIYISEEKLRTYFFGYQRFTVFHEFGHAKFHDAAIQNFIKKANFIPVHITAKIEVKYLKYCEGRADRYAAKAVACAQCVYDGAKVRAKRLDPYGFFTMQELLDVPGHHYPDPDGYLDHSALLEIAKEHRHAKKYCKYHNNEVTP